MAQFVTAAVVGSTTPALDLVTVIEAQLTAAGWVKPFADAADLSLTTYTNRVWRCPAAVSGYTADFYVIISSLTATTGASVHFTVAEAADGTTGRFFRMNGQAAAGTAPIAADGSFGTASSASAAPGANVTSTHSAFTESGGTVTTNTTNFTYWVVATKRGLFVRTSLSSGGPLYAGLFESLLINANEFPLFRGILGNATGTTSSSNTCTRRPGQDAASYTATIGISLVKDSCWGRPLGLLANGSTSVDVYGSIAGARPILLHDSSAKTAIERGILYDILLFNSTSGVMTVGDTLTLNDGTRYVCIHPGGASVSLWVNRDAV